jgi:hypothetical protein
VNYKIRKGEFDIMKKLKLLLSVLIFMSFISVSFAARIDDYFEYAKKNEALLTAFINKMPKGADFRSQVKINGNKAYAEQLINYIIKNNLYFDRVTLNVTSSTKNSKWSAKDLAYNQKVYDEVLNSISNRNFYMNIGQFVEEAITKAASQNILYVEIAAIPQGDDIEAWLDSVEMGLKAANASTKKKIEIGIVLAIDTNDYPIKEIPFNDKDYLVYFSQQVSKSISASIKHQNRLTRGIVLFPSENGWISKTQFDNQLNILNRYWKAYKDRGIDINSIVYLDGSQNLNKNYDNPIGRSIVLGHARKIGGSQNISWENDVYDLLGFMRENRIAAEISPLTDGNATQSNNSFILYRDAGVPIVINSGLQNSFSISNLTLEYVKAALQFNLQYKDIKTLSLNSLEYSFIPGESLFERGDYSRIKKVLPRNSQKARLQQTLLEAFADFEHNMDNIIRADFSNAVEKKK